MQAKGNMKTDSFFLWLLSKYYCKLTYRPPKLDKGKTPLVAVCFPFNALFAHLLGKNCIV